MSIISSPSRAIVAEKDNISKTVLMPGDPLRAKYIAENYLEDSVCFNTVRGMLGYTGYYNGKRISVMGHGMGVPSIGIYSYELYKFFDVETIIRIGTIGALADDVKLRDVIIALAASTDSHFSDQYSFPGLLVPSADYQLISCAAKNAEKLGINVKIGQVFTSDVFYNTNEESNKIYSDFGILGVEMEAAGLYWTAQHLKKRALCILSVSNHIFSGESLEADEIRSSLDEMIRLALDTACDTL